VVVVAQAVQPVLLEWAAAWHGGRETGAPADLSISLATGADTLTSPHPPTCTEHATGYRLAHVGWRADFYPAKATAQVTLSADSDNARGPRRVAAAIRAVVARHLVPRGGLSFHAASVLSNGRAWLFAGPRGAGKTTLARRWPASARLGDDHVIVCPDTVCPDLACAGPIGYRAFGTPYAGREGTRCTPGDAPVGAIFLLEQAPLTAIEPVGHAAAVRTLLQTVIHISAGRSDTEAALDALHRLVRRVPIRRLRFTLGASVESLLPLEPAR